MAFVIEISQVGPPEYPLMQTLRDTIFGAFGHTSITPIEQQLADRHDLRCLIAHLEGNPVGFAVGYRRSAGVFYLNYLGLLPDYRGQSLGRQMLARQEEFARAGKYRQIEFNTFNHFPGMLRLGLRSGYIPVGVEQHTGTGNDLSIRFAKRLEAPPQTGPQHPVPAGRETRISTSEPEKIAAAIGRGGSIVGMVREGEPLGQLQVIIRAAS